jgi:signal transduction histidine kinase
MIRQVVGGDEERLAAVQALGLMSYMCVPVPGRERVAGAVTFAVSVGGREFTDDDLRFAQDVASRIGMAVENARAYDEARRANRVKDDFLATLSHELRTPLNAILGYVHMMRGGAVPPERAAHAMAVIERNATALAQIVADVLEVSRIAAGKLRLAVQEVDLVRIVQESIETVAPSAEEKRIALTVAAAPGAVVVDGDGDRLQQVVWNLLSNAIKFTPEGGRVQVDLARDRGGVCVSVRDSGVGIPPHSLAHIFEPFHQADSGPAREFGGLGLGLAIARRIVELHGGAIEVESEGEGRGSEFRMRLPARD